MYIISLSCIMYTYCNLILKSPSGRINKKSIVLYRTKAPARAQVRSGTRSGISPLVQARLKCLTHTRHSNQG